MKGLRKEFPREIQVKEGIWYKIRFIRGLNTRGFNGKTYEGLCWGAPSREIWISTGQSPKLRLHTYFHELGHAIEFEYGIKVKHKDIDVIGEAMGYIVSMNAWMSWFDWKDVG
jgi:Zn-dependent peptidase ImmA (M78 family)